MNIHVFFMEHSTDEEYLIHIGKVESGGRLQEVKIRPGEYWSDCRASSAFNLLVLRFGRTR